MSPHSAATKKWKIWLAGSTRHTVMAVQELLTDAQFEITLILTPPPKPIGRDQHLTANPLDLLAQKYKIPTVYVDKKIDSSVQTQLKQFTNQTSLPDFLLVIDFGYLIPDWLLQLPAIAPINIHPSKLPAWRGASPGQFVLMSDVSQSSMAIIQMAKELDCGPIYTQIGFEVDPNWTSADYYDFSFQLVANYLPTTLAKIADGLSPQPQPVSSPTPPARQLKKTDGYIPFGTLQKILNNESLKAEAIPSFWLDVWNQAAIKVKSPASILNRQIKALQPWPGVWTQIQTNQGLKTMKILSLKSADLHKPNTKLKPASHHFVLEKVQVAGQNPALFNQIKNQILPD